MARRTNGEIEDAPAPISFPQARYTGQYLLENQHGRGVYLHPTGFKYMGYLFAGDAEFCGRALSPTGAEYQGMFYDGLPHGVGQVTYGGGLRRDVGLWWRGRLVRLLCPSPTAVSFERLLTGHYIGWYDRRVLHVQEQESPLESVLKELESGAPTADRPLDQLDRMTNLKLRDRRTAAFPSHRCGQLPTGGDSCPQEVVPASVQELLRPERLSEVPPGRLQRASLLLLHASALNRPDVVRLLLRTVRISPNVADAAGVSALICAAMRGHTAAVNTLLDHGADVNQLTDCGLSALSLCLSLHHPDYSTRYHLDQLSVFTHLELNDELDGVLEWHGGEPRPCERCRRPFPARPVPLAARRQKAVRRPRPRRSPGTDSSEPPDIRQALVPGPALTLEHPPSSSRRRRQGSHAHPHPPGEVDTARAATGHSREHTPDTSEVPAGSPQPSHVETAQRPRTPTAETRAAARTPDSLQTPAEDSREQREPEGSAQSGTGSESNSPPAAADDDATVPGSAAPSRRPSADHSAADGPPSPPAWPPGWPEEPDAAARPPAASLLSARTDDGTDGSWWERLPAELPRCCPSVERALAAAAAAAADESNQETAVRLIEAFCGAVDGRIPETEYTSPCPGSADMLAMIRLLLRRGASPEASNVPFPAVHHALLADDKPLLAALLAAGGDPNSRLPHQLGGLSPLHVSCSLPGDGSLQLSALLLQRGADPNAASDRGSALLDPQLLQRRQLPLPEQLGARTPLHVVCQRPADSYDQKVVSRRLMNLLEDSGADVEALCNGHSPTTLALLTGDMTLAVDLMTRGADPLRHLGPPHYDALGLAVSPAVEPAFQLEERKQMLKGAQRGQKKQREAFLAFLSELVSDELRRHQHMAPLVEQGLFEDAELTTAEYTTASGASPAEPAAADSSPDAGRRKRKRKLVVLSAECFCPICDRVLGKCFKGCPNYGRRTPKLMSAELRMDSFADDLLNSESDEDASKAGKKGKRRKRRAEADDGELAAHVELGNAMLGPDGKPLKCHACRKNLKRRKIVCSACKQVIYCSKKCRAADWDKSHGFTCPARSQMSLSRLQDSNGTSSTRTRGTSADSGPQRGDGSERAGRSGRRPDDAGGRTGSLDDRGRAGRRRGRGRAGRSLDTHRPGHPRMAPIAGRMPPWLAAFMAQFEGMHIGECRHLVLGEWYEDNCKMKENYSYV
ncbi:Ankyrin repeat and MYND domain-containing protein 1 [Amphibalanus amphitrite]|uniref:Ankyrin repeat and MYND domain-containing protein 1 n=1 Tax=Amphibalanus amphitrite TaxID=1232801 RepID=A0A6A4W9B2_AMPAM|nr:Ankyrin repeat and MYND domain-containing protein 1 [Amphibalanus amphitrite]